MSDMSRPSSPPPAIDHEQHDVLLVAQFVADDPLGPERQAEAQRLLADCGACSALAADLPVVSRAVAQEPVPPRRRDFRLSPEQADELRGNPLVRFLRRLSLPGSRAFQPAAAGVLSIGLLFVVAGYAWPENGTVVVQAEPNFVDWSVSASDAPDASAPAVEEPAPLAAPELDATEALEGAERLMEESDFADTLAESQAGLSERATQKSSADEAAAEVATGAIELEALSEPAPAADTDDGEARREAAADAVEESAEDASTGSGAQAEGQIDDVTTDETAAYLASDDAGNVVEPADVADIDPADDGGLEELFIVLGLVLALGGAGLLLLGWLARRARDPLAP